MLQLRPTFSESWYRVVNLRAKLRPSAQVSRTFYRGERWYVMRDPAGNQFHRLNDAAYHFVALLDGSRTVGEAWELVGGQLDDEAPTQPEVIQILSQLHAANLIESDVSADATVLLRRHKMQMKRKMQGRLMNVLFPRIPIWDPDQFLKRWMPMARLVLNKVGAIVWLALILAAVAALAPRWEALKGAANNAIAPGNWIFLWATFCAIKFIHELGHAYACRRFGGEVHEMGIMFLVFIPTPYVDASTAWAFPSKWQRIFVGAAGMIFELFVASIMAFVWLNTSPGVPVYGIPVNELAYNAMLIASVTTVIFNANPLLRYDGYYMLSDYLEIPNLQQKSKEYLLGLVKRHVFRVKSQTPLPPPVQRFWLFFYGLASSAYRIFVGVMIILLVAYKVPVLGVLMALGGVITWIVMPLVQIVKYLALQPELHRKRGRATLFVLACAAAIIIAIGIIPSWVYVEGTGTVVPEERSVLYARWPGFVDQVLAKDGQWMQKDEPIIICKDAELDAKLVQVRAQLSELRAREQQAMVEDPGARKMYAEHIKAVEQQLANAEVQRDQLTIRAPFTGTLIAPDIHQLAGRFLPPGQELGSIATMDRLLVRTVLEQRDAQLARRLQSEVDGKLERKVKGSRRGPDTPVTEIRLAGVPNHVIPCDDVRLVNSALAKLPHASLGHAGGGSIATDPRDAQGEKPMQRQFELRIALANPNGVYLPGQRAFVRVEVDRKPLIWQWGIRFLQLIEARSQDAKWL